MFSDRQVIRQLIPTPPLEITAWLGKKKQTRRERDGQLGYPLSHQPIFLGHSAVYPLSQHTGVVSMLKRAMPPPPPPVPPINSDCSSWLLFLPRREDAPRPVRQQGAGCEPTTKIRPAEDQRKDRLLQMTAQDSRKIKTNYPGWHNKVNSTLWQRDTIRRVTAKAFPRSLEESVFWTK